MRSVQHRRLPFGIQKVTANHALIMLVSIGVCLTTLALTIVLVRNGRPTLGLPVGYLYLLLLIHVPGAVAHLTPKSNLPYKEFTETGIRYTAFGCVAFVVGLWLARVGGVKRGLIFPHPGPDFLRFCLIGGWIVTFSLRPILVRIPSLGAAVDNGGRIWLLAVILALPLCFLRRDWRGFLIWASAMLVYPVMGLVNTGFLSYGTTTTVLAFSLFAVVIRSWWKLGLIIAVVSVLGMGLFVSYFTIREDIRGTVWGGHSLEERVNESGRMLREFKTFDLEDEKHLKAVNARLNQNVFVGMAAARLNRGVVDYYRGRTLWEGVLSVIPRAFWPGKPVFGGSHGIINQMTEFEVNEKTTSYGVGNVMEFYINFGLPSLIAGFIAFGWLLGKLDRLAATAWIEGRFTDLIKMFLPAVAIIRPEHSTVEIVGSAVAALVATFFWAQAWRPGGKGNGGVSPQTTGQRWQSGSRLDGLPVSSGSESGSASEVQSRDWEETSRDDFRF